MMLRYLPNIITVTRLLLIAPTVYCLLQQQLGWALLLFALAAFSDAVDGFLAKRFGWISRAGGILDPLADKLLLVSSVVCLVILGWIPGWLALLILGRDVLIVVGACVYHFWITRFDARPSVLSKFTTCLQIVWIVAVMLEQYMAWHLYSAILEWAVVGATVLSGTHYVVSWTLRAWRVTRWRIL